MKLYNKIGIQEGGTQVLENVFEELWKDQLDGIHHG